MTFVPLAQGSYPPHLLPLKIIGTKIPRLLADHARLLGPQSIRVRQFGIQLLAADRQYYQLRLGIFWGRQ